MIEIGIELLLFQSHQHKKHHRRTDHHLRRLYLLTLL
jgi:hypothetical protein